MNRNSDVASKMAIATLPSPYLLMEKSSPREKRSSPNTRRMIHFLQNATGTSAEMLSPARPSVRKSTANPVANATNNATVVEYLDGMHRIIVGSIVRSRYGVTWK